MEKAVLIITDFGKRGEWDSEQQADELKALSRAARVYVETEVVANLKRPTPELYIGRGKAEEIAQIARQNECNVIIFNDDLSGTQQKNLEEIIDAKTIDRTQLILDIFARRAHSKEGKIQVELAQLSYLAGRLTGKGIMLSRLGGGIGTRGPGETKLEVDRRRIKERISRLKKELLAAQEQRMAHRKTRKDFACASIAIVGYTNAGKSTLLNALTHSRIVVRDQLFSTLDPTIRGFSLPNKQKVIFTDTVGFLHHLPHHLIESFKATLEEVVDADILLHVLDISDALYREKNQAVCDTLGELGALNKPLITALNKTDRIEDKSVVETIKNKFKDSVAISAEKRRGFEELFHRIEERLGHFLKYVKLDIPQKKAYLVSQIYEHGNVLACEYHADVIHVEAELPERIIEIVKSASANTKK